MGVGAERVCDFFGGLEFTVVALGVVEGDAVAGSVLLACDGEGRGGVEPAGEEDDGDGVWHGGW